MKTHITIELELDDGHRVTRAMTYTGPPGDEAKIRQVAEMVRFSIHALHELEEASPELLD